MNAEMILEYLSMVSNQNLAVNLIMHLVILGAVFAVFAVKNILLKKLIVNSAILILSLSVLINAWIYGNPFHLVTFAILAGFAGWELLTGKNNFHTPEMNSITLIALVFIVLGLWYPDFVEVNKVQSLLFAPVGIVPCPTLLVTLGLLSLAYTRINMLQYVVTITMGLIFGIIGTFVLKVYLDVSLLLAVLFSLWILVQRKKYSAG